MRRLTLLGGIGVLCGAWAGSAPLDLGHREVVAFVGGSDLAVIQRGGELEAALTQRNRDKRPRFRDLAWEGDTVYFQGTVGERWRREAFGGWPEQLDRVGATLVLVQFGKIESLEGTEQLPRFVEAYRRLLAELRGNGRRVVVLGPSRPGWPGFDAGSLRAYRTAAEDLAREGGHRFVEDDWSRPPGGGIREALAGGIEVSPDLLFSVREKHRLWREYWRPSNWKCLFGDDSQRVFSNAAYGLPSFREEWETYPAIIREAEEAIFNGKRWGGRAAPERTGTGEANIEDELRSFEVLEGFEVNLFADERLGVANPLSVRWDSAGRMFVACSDTYPQVEPGVRSDDRVMVLVDHDEDGRADESEVVVDGLQIPTGMEVSAEGVFIGQGTDLLSVRPGADGSWEREPVLAGFGNGDSHQTINSFVWSPGGELWFCQGDGIESRVETPFGVSSLFQAGVFRLQPNTSRLDALLDDFMGPGNPWGVAFDDFGQAVVVDGAGGISHLTPASIPAKRRLRLPRIGDPGGYCGVECLGAGCLPEGMQGEFLVGDYKRNQVGRFALEDDGAGFLVVWREPLLRSRHRNFRPIDVKVGPDGAIYVVDWYNPITCHQDDFYRHPERDQTHGRIWRIAPKSGVVGRPALQEVGSDELVELLGADERWTRLKVKQVLAARDRGEVTELVRNWASKQANGGRARDLFEAVSLLEWLECPDGQVLSLLAASDDPRARAYAARVSGKWWKALPDWRSRLDSAARDENARVRMEAILAAGQIPVGDAILVVAVAVESGRDRWIDYAFAQAVHHLKPHWLAALKDGELDPSESQAGFAAVLGASESRGVLGEVRNLWRSSSLDEATRRALSRTLVLVGNEEDVMEVVRTASPDEELLEALAGRGRPGGAVEERLREWYQQGGEPLRVGVLRLAGRWKLEGWLGLASEVARDRSRGVALRAAAVRAWGALEEEPVSDSLERLFAEEGGPRGAILEVLLQRDPAGASRLAASLLVTLESREQIQEIYALFGGRQGAGEQLALRLEGVPVRAEQAARLLEVWRASGLSCEPLRRSLQELAGVPGAELPYDRETVATLVAAGKAGDALRGERLFRSAGAGCLACHQVAGQGGRLGPDLSAVGTGMLPDRLVVEVFWPAEQIKDGFALTQVMMNDGRLLQGYVQSDRQQATLRLRDFATGEMLALEQAEIAEIEERGTIMPPVAQGFSEEERADLLAYLFTLDGTTRPPGEGKPGP